MDLTRRCKVWRGMYVISLLRGACHKGRLEQNRFTLTRHKPGSVGIPLAVMKKTCQNNKVIQ